MNIYEYLKCECGARLLQGGISKKSQNLYIKRTRKCETCKKLVHTIEIPIDVYDKSVELLNTIIQTIKNSQQ